MAESSLSKILGLAFLSPKISVVVCTVGGVDDDGNDVSEPEVFNGYYFDAVKFFNDPNNLYDVQNILDEMPDGYIIVETGNYSREVYDAMEILEAIDEIVR